MIKEWGMRMIPAVEGFSMRHESILTLGQMIGRTRHRRQGGGADWQGLAMAPRIPGAHWGLSRPYCLHEEPTLGG